MGIVCHSDDALHGNVTWQDAIELESQIGGVEFLFVCCMMVKMGHHAVGVDSCIRASCPHSLDGGAQEGGQTLVEFLLDSDGIGLDLPSMVGRTVERQADKIAHGVGYGVVNVCDVVRVLLAKIGICLF